MSMKLAQRLVIGYYKTKLNAIALVSPAKAAEAAFRLFCTPYSGKPKRKRPAVFHHGEKLQFTVDNLRINGYRFTSENGHGKKLLIVHGFDSCMYKFDRYVSPIRREGWDVYAFDAPGHGTSEGKYLNAVSYSDMLLEAEKIYGPFDGILAHSIGGLAAVLAWEQLNTTGRKMILIAPATETTSALDNFFSLIKVNPAIRIELEKLIIELAQQPISYFSIRRAIQHIPASILWLHDEDDRICPYADVLPIQSDAHPNIQFYTTKGLGHSRIYKENKVKKAILSFLADQP